jgi:chromosome segregation ATPase
LENNFYQNQSKMDPGEDKAEAAAVQPPSSEPAPVVAGDSSAPTGTEAPRSQSPTKGEHKEGEKRSVVDLATEMRVIGKVRKEMDHKFHTAEVHMDTKISSFNLQLERLMKLLQIRPTTSELQTVMNAVYDVDKKVASSMEEIKNDMRTALKTNLSEEITSIIEEVKQSNNLSESGIKYMQQTVDGFAASLTDVREVTENTVVLMNEAMEKLQNHNSDLEDHIAKLKFQMDKQLQAQAGELAALKADHAVLFEEFTEYRNRKDEEAAHLAMTAAEEKAKFEEEIARLDYALSESDARIQANAVYIQTLESKAEASQAEQAQKNKAVTDTLAEYAFKLERLRKDTDTLMAHDTPAKVLDLQEEIKKSNINIATCSDAIEKYVNGDLKQLNVKVAILQEQCNIQIPSAYGEMLVRIETLNEQLVSTNNGLEKTQIRLQATDDTVGELMPLVDRMTAVEVHSKDHVNELNSLKESLTNTIDTTDELIRRLEEAEEIVDGLENSVTNRMNQVMFNKTCALSAHHTLKDRSSRGTDYGGYGLFSLLHNFWCFSCSIDARRAD